MLTGGQKGVSGRCLTLLEQELTVLTTPRAIQGETGTFINFILRYSLIFTVILPLNHRHRAHVTRRKVLKVVKTVQNSGKQENNPVIQL